MNLAKRYHSLSRLVGKYLLRKIINKVNKTTTIKWLIGIALLNIQITAYSQYFIDDNKEWAIVSTYSTKSNPKWTTYYKFMGDSTINGFTYHKLYHSTDSNQVNWTLNSFWWERNDSIFRRCQNNGNLNDTIILMYDFNLQEEDTFRIDEYEWMKVDSIRYLEWGGSIRKHWFFSYYGIFITWVEGVGSLENFSCPAGYLNSLSESLLCFYENENVVYHSPSHTDCYVYTGVPSIKKNQEFINIFPNPATNKLTLNTYNFQLLPFTFQLYDMQGSIQREGKITNMQAEINVVDLPRGLYVLKIVTDKQMITKKVVLQ